MKDPAERAGTLARPGSTGAPAHEGIDDDGLRHPRYRWPTTRQLRTIVHMSKGRWEMWRFGDRTTSLIDLTNARHWKK